MSDNPKGSPRGGFGDEHEKDWREYKRIRNTFSLVFVTYVPVCFGVAVVSGKFLGTLTPAFVVAGLWMVLFAFNGLRLSTWRCPSVENGSRRHRGTT